MGLGGCRWESGLDRPKCGWNRIWGLLLLGNDALDVEVL
jgi:hypothetical protein